MSMEHPEKQKNAVKSVVDQVMDGIISQIIDGTLHPCNKHRRYQLKPHGSSFC